jgi:hypothetical protein
MADNLITSTIILNKTMQVLHNESAFLGNINTEFNDEFAKKGMKAGATVYPRRPVQFRVRDGATASLQDVNETSVAVTVEPEFGIDFDFTEFDRTLSVDDFSKRYMTPAGKRLATELDSRIATRFYQSVANHSGTPGTTPSTALAMLKAAAILDDIGSCPRDGLRTAALNPLAMAYMVDGLKGLLNDAGIIGKQTKTGLLETNLGMSFQMSQNVPTHTVGVATGTPLVNGATQGTTTAVSTENPYAATTSLVTDGWTNSTAGILKKGDVITLAGVYAVNLENKNTLSYLKQFVVTADVTSGAATGPATVIVSPAIIAAGAYQNVTALPADNAAITVVTGSTVTSYPQNMLFHKDAFTMVTVAMDVPNGMDMAEQITYEGVNLRFVRGFDITNNKRISRFDLMAGFGALRPEWAIRVPG